MKDTTPSAVTALRRIVQGLWRRRFLIIVPFLTMIPISIAAAYLMPASFSTTALVLVTDASAAGPLPRASTGYEAARVQDRIGSFRALLVSYDMLQKVVGDLSGHRLEPARERRMVESLQQSLDVIVVGWNMLRFELRTTFATGAGKDLQLIIDQFQTSARATGLIRETESMRAIDPPRDPEKPRRSRALIFIAGMMAGAVLGIALAIMAELLDNLLRLPEEIAEVTDVPVIAFPETVALEAPPAPPSRRGITLPLLGSALIAASLLAVVYRENIDQIQEKVAVVIGTLRK